MADDDKPRQDKQQNNRGRIFFGWWTVLATSIISAWSYGSWFYGFGAYVKPLMEEFNWTRAEISAAYSLNRLEGGVEGPWGGMFTDKYGPRIVVLLGMFLAGLGLCLLYFVNTLWQFILIWGVVVSLGFNLGTMDPLEKALSDWFLKKRGLAMGLARAGLGLGGAFGPPLMTTLLVLLGWRMAFVLAGLITWVIGIPLAWFCVKAHRPEHYGVMPDGVNIDLTENVDPSSIIKVGQELAAKVGEIEFTLKQAIKTRAFWIIVIEFIMIGFIFPCVNVHMIPHLLDMGMNPLSAASALGFTALVSTPGRLIIGPICDRCPKHKFKYIRMLADFLRTLGLFLFMISTNLLMVYFAAGIYGLGLGFSAGSMSPLRGRFFGRKAFSSIHGTATMLSMPASIIAPIYIGWVYDTMGSYTIAFTNACIMGVIAVIIQIFLKPPEEPEVISDVKKFL